MGYDETMKDLMDALAGTPRMLAHLVVEVTEEELDRAPAGEWSPRTVMAHLRDDEFLVMRMRLARMLSEDGPVFANFDEQAWAETRSRHRDRKEELLGDFALQRQASLNVLANLRPADESRPGRHEEYGEYTVRSWVKHWLDHDREHIGQLERLLGETAEDAQERRRQDTL